MVTHGRVELLAHPLSQKYLQMKWNAYGKYFHVTNLLIYTVFLSFVTMYASQLMQSVDTHITRPNNMSTIFNSSGEFNSSVNITDEVNSFLNLTGEASSLMNSTGETNNTLSSAPPNSSGQVSSFDLS